MSGSMPAAAPTPRDPLGSLTLKVMYLRVEQLTPNKRNARVHSKKQLQQILNSLKEFGFVTVILVDENLMIIAGHGRWLAAKMAGLIEVPVIVLSHLTEQQKTALSLADNRIPIGASWSEELLNETLQSLSVDINFDLTLTGFTAPEISLRLSPKLNGSEDIIPAYPTAPRAKLGDVIVLGRHRIGCGDARDQNLMRRMMGGVTANVAVMDITYGLHPMK